MAFWRNYGFSEQCYLKADSVSNLAKAGHAQLQYMKLSPLREISTQGGKKGMKMLMMSQCLKIIEKSLIQH